MWTKTLLPGTTILLLALGMTAPPVRAAGDEVFFREETKDGSPIVILGNRFVELTFEPARGGRCSSFRFFDQDEQIIGNAPVSGLFIDHWAKYPWPSGLMWLPYQYRIVGDGRSKVGLQLWIKVPERGGGKGSPDAAGSITIPTSPDLIGMTVRKTIWLNADTDMIEIEQEVENSTSESHGVALYLQHNLALNGDSLHDNWYMPSAQGVVVNVQPGGEHVRAVGPDWVLQPTEGWMAAIDRETRKGLLFAFDYNYLEKLYTSGQTAEWFMETVPLGPGKSFRTRYIVKPLEDLRDVVFGSPNLVADLRPDEVGETVRVMHELAAVSREAADVEIDFSIVGWKTGELIAKETFRLENLGFDALRQEFHFTPRSLSEGVVINVVVTSPEFEERYEYYYAGDREELERRYNYHANRDGALAGTKGNAYTRKTPRKVKKFDKPDFSKIGGPAPDPFRCLVVFGLYTHVLDLDDALADWKHQGRVSPDITWANCPPNAVEAFPGTYDELFAYHVVVLCDVNYKAIGDLGFEMLCDYVEHGGSLLVTGGPYAFGNGEFEETRFLDLLPVTLSGPFDLKWAGRGTSWPLAPAQEGLPLLEGLSFEREPRVFWNHIVTPKSGTEVVLKAGGHPALILGGYGQGRVAVLTLSPTGMGTGGETAWWAWEGWFPLVRNIFSFLGDER